MAMSNPLSNSKGRKKTVLLEGRLNPKGGNKNVLKRNINIFHTKYHLKLKTKRMQ
jgi:hypothetical protein